MAPIEHVTCKSRNERLQENSLKLYGRATNLRILRLALIPALRDSRGAQDGRVGNFDSSETTTAAKGYFRYCIALKDALFSISPQG